MRAGLQYAEKNYVVSWLFTVVNSTVTCCTIRGYEVFIGSDDSERDTITVLKNSTYHV